MTLRDMAHHDLKDEIARKSIDFLDFVELIYECIIWGSVQPSKALWTREE